MEVQNVVDTVFGDMSSKVEEYAQNSIKQFGMSELSFKQYASRFQAMGSAMGIDTSSIESANSFLNKATGGYVGLSDSMADVSLTLMLRKICPLSSQGKQDHFVRTVWI